MFMRSTRRLLSQHGARDEATPRALLIVWIRQTRGVSSSEQAGSVGSTSAVPVCLFAIKKTAISSGESSFLR